MIVLSATTITVVLYVCVTTCFITILLRLIISWKLTRAWTPEDGWMLGTLCFLVGLWFSGHGIKYDTNNVAHPELLTAHEIERRVIGSKTVLVGRFCYASSIWCMKFCILAVYARVVDKLPSYARFIKYLWACLLLTWAAAIIVTLVECRPFNHYWQVYPSPALSCKTARLQILVVGICNMATDLMLIVFPIPMVLRTSLPLKTKLELCALFSLGFVIIAISALRIWALLQHGSLQRWRTMFGSLELLAACGVTNGPVFYRVVVGRIAGRPKTFTTEDSVESGRDRGGPSQEGVEMWGGESCERLAMV